MVGLYLAPPANAVVFAVDEKPQIQALERTAPVLPMIPGVPERRSSGYTRHGTIDLFAALNTATGKVIGKLSAQHRAVDFRDFLDEIDRQTEPGLAIHVICDNLSAHKAPPGPPPEQEQEYPGRTAEMDPAPRDEMRDYEGRGLLTGTRALITGGDSGIGRAVAVAFAKEGADVAIAYLSETEDEDAARTAELVRAAGQRCVTIRGDLAIEDNCQRAVEQTVTELGGLDVLVNNVATQEPVDDLGELSTSQWERTFRVNVHSYFWTTRAALKHLPDGGVIINTSSINGLRGNKTLIDYAATKGAILAFTYSLAQALQGPRHPGQQRCPRPGLDPADPRDLRRGPGQLVRRAGTHGPGRPSRRDRPLVRLLRQRQTVQLLLRRGTRTHRR